VEIGIIIAIILMMFALGLTLWSSPLKELVRLTGTAVCLAAVMLVAICRPRPLAAA
jgi:hypothetical protein